MSRIGVAIGLVCILGHATPARADESDNFTCRSRIREDSLLVLDTIINERIQAVLEWANRPKFDCDADCVADRLRQDIGGSYRHPLTGIPHAKFERWIGERSDVDRCRLKFRDSIYGARPYNHPWLWPFTGRIILLADSIRVADHIVGIDKINHFIREGLAHWRAMQRPEGDITAVMEEELGSPTRQFRFNEYGLRGWTLTGVLSYADLAASYSGFRFWSDVSSIDRPESFVGRDPETGRFVQRRAFTFTAYVNAAWDEGINCSEFHPALAKQVQAALAKQSLTCPAADPAALATLEQASLFVNPRLLDRDK